MADPRPTLRPITTGLDLDEIVKVDMQKLMADPAFHRVMFTFFEMAGMYHGSFHPEVGASQWSEGRRGLGFDMLGRLTEVSSDAHLRILTAAQPHKEASNGRRKQRSRTDRNADGYVNPDVDGPIRRERPVEREIDYDND